MERKQTLQSVFASSSERSLPGLYLAASFLSNNAIHWVIPDHLLIYNVQNSHCKLINLPCVGGDSYQNSPSSIWGCLWEAEGRVRYSYADSDGVHTFLTNKILITNNIDREKFKWTLADSLHHQIFKKNYPKIFKRGNESKPQHLSPFAYKEFSQTVYMQLEETIISCNTKTGALEESFVNSAFKSYFSFVG